MSTKKVTPFTAQLVSFETPLPYSEVVSRLENAVNKNGSAQKMSLFKEAKSKEEIINIIKSITAERDFLYFMDISHHSWLDIYEGKKHPATINFIIGNPLVAQTILTHDLSAGLNIPPRLVILEKEDGTGTVVQYHLPSSFVLANDDSAAKEAARKLDEKMESLVLGIIFLDVPTRKAGL